MSPSMQFGPAQVFPHYPFGYASLVSQHGLPSMIACGKRQKQLPVKFPVKHFDGKNHHFCGVHAISPTADRHSSRLRMTESRNTIARVCCTGAFDVCESPENHEARE